MDSLQFAFWLRGFFELNGETALTKEQSQIISKHLTLVFKEKAKDLPPVSKELIWDDRTYYKHPYPTEMEILCSNVDSVANLVDSYNTALESIRTDTKDRVPTVSCLAHTSPAGRNR